MVNVHFHSIQKQQYTQIINESDAEFKFIILKKSTKLRMQNQESKFAAPIKDLAIKYITMQELEYKRSQNTNPLTTVNEI